MVDQKDVIIAVLGASVGLAGLLLVFSGFIFGQVISLPKTLDDSLIHEFKKAAQFALYPFEGFLLVTILAVVWLLHQCRWLYILSVALFLLLIVGTGLYGFIVSRHYL